MVWLDYSTRKAMLFFTFCLDTKSNQKGQDLDLFAKKVYIPLKDLNLRGTTIVFLKLKFGRASDKKSF